MSCDGKTQVYEAYRIRGSKWRQRPCRIKYTKHLRLVHRDRVIFDGHLCHVHRKAKIRREALRVGLKVFIDGVEWRGIRREWTDEWASTSAD
jgi:hypothetical protein